MKSLSETWFADGYIDFELKKYTLLAYLQEVSKYFNENKLYPQLADIIFHYNNLVAFKKNKQYLQEQFPKRLTGIQIEKLQLLYQSLVEDDELMQELEEITAQVATEARRPLQILERHGQPADHPVSLACPETSYLKCLVFRLA